MQTWFRYARARTESHRRSALPYDDLLVRGTHAEIPPNTRRFRLRQKSAPAQSRKWNRSLLLANLRCHSAQQKLPLLTSARIPCDVSLGRSAIALQMFGRDTTPRAPPIATLTRPRHD